MMRAWLGGLLLFMALNAIGGSLYGLIAGAPGVPPEWLEGSPFETYFIPSLFLFVVIGGLCTASAIAIFASWRSARRLAMAAGVMMLVWIAAQVALIGYVSWLQPAVALVGLLVLVMAARLPGTQRPSKSD